MNGRRDDVLACLGRGTPHATHAGAGGLAAGRSAVRPAYAALSSWLSAGEDPTEVAEREGNSVEALPSRYAKCLDGRQDVANRRIAQLLGDNGDQEAGHGDGARARAGKSAPQSLRRTAALFDTRMIQTTGPKSCPVTAA